MPPEARQGAEPLSPDRPEKGRPSPAIAILVNGASSSGKSTFCRALQERLTQLADGNPAAAFARVAFDDVVLLIAERLYPISVVKLQGGDLSRLASHEPHDGRAAWEYVDESDAEGLHGGGPRLRLVLNPHGRRLLSGVHRSWGAHLELGTHLIIDHFLQDAAWGREGRLAWPAAAMSSATPTGSPIRCGCQQIGSPRRSLWRVW